MGDDIVDEYCYVRVVGKAVKENALSSIAIGREEFRGGVVAAAMHTMGFCAHVDVFHGNTVMWNARLVDEVYLRKLAVVHEVRENHRSSQWIEDFGRYDLVIVCDFGHGFMTDEMIERVTKEAKYLAINAQTNATNYGFNLITKYPRADLVVIDELEARLAAHDNKSDLKDIVAKLGFKRMIVTRGVAGALGYEDGVFHEAAALTNKVTDSMGAGDAFLAVCSPFAAIKTPMDVLTQIGNAAGAVKVEIVGHRSSVTPERLGAKLPMSLFAKEARL